MGRSGDNGHGGFFGQFQRGFVFRNGGGRGIGFFRLPEYEIGGRCVFAEYGGGLFYIGIGNGVVVGFGKIGEGSDA